MKWDIPFQDIAKAVSSCVASKDWQWPYNSRCKYVTITVDMRSGICALSDRHNKEIKLEELLKQHSNKPLTKD